MRLRAALLFVITLAASAYQTPARTLTGWLGKSAYRIDVPGSSWNGNLIMYCHGFTLRPPTPEQLSLAPLLKILLDQGFAIAQAGYSSAGWSVTEGLADTEALRKDFQTRVGLPKKTFLVGESLGGFLVPVLLERAATPYAAGLALCAPLASSDWFVNRRMVDLRAVFDFYFPEALPRLDGDFALGGGEDVFAKVAALLGANEAKAAEVRRFSAIRTNKDLAAAIEIYTYALADIKQRAGGSPFDNRNAIYSGTSDDWTLNRGVIRYAPDRHALEYLERHYAISGALKSPLLALYPTYDPFVPASSGELYPSITDEAGAGELLVRRMVPSEGHCNIAPADSAREFANLVEWQATGVRPPTGSK